MSPISVYRKTSAGVEEVQTCAAGLHPQTRRVLILTDGITPLARISSYVRGADIAPLVDELLRLGFIEAAGRTVTEPKVEAPRLPKPEEFPGPTPKQMEAIREIVLYAVHSMIGFSATQLELRIIECDNAVEMRQIVGEIRNIMDRQLGTGVGDRFIEAVRSVSQAAR